MKKALAYAVRYAAAMLSIVVGFRIMMAHVDQQFAAVLVLVAPFFGLSAALVWLPHELFVRFIPWLAEGDPQ